jgi:hypothetical protein
MTAAFRVRRSSDPHFSGCLPTARPDETTSLSSTRSTASAARSRMASAQHSGRGDQQSALHRPGRTQRNRPRRRAAIIHRKLSPQTRDAESGQPAALLKGPLFAPDGTMSPTHARRRGKFCRCYAFDSRPETGGRRLYNTTRSSGEIEAAVIHQSRALLHAPEIIVQTWRAARRE